MPSIASNTSPSCQARATRKESGVGIGTSKSTKAGRQLECAAASFTPSPCIQLAEFPFRRVRRRTRGYLSDLGPATVAPAGTMTRRSVWRRNNIVAIHDPYWRQFLSMDGRKFQTSGVKSRMAAVAGARLSPMPSSKEVRRPRLQHKDKTDNQCLVSYQEKKGSLLNCRKECRWWPEVPMSPFGTRTRDKPLLGDLARQAVDSCDAAIPCLPQYFNRHPR